jgi:hypothetical protein
MQEKRKNTRYRSRARASIPGIFEGDAILKDISITGCSIEYTVQVDVKPNTKYTIQIFPEGASGIGQFDILTECRWFRGAGNSYEIGFMIIESPKGKQFQRYVDYLTWQSS